MKDDIKQNPISKNTRKMLEFCRGKGDSHVKAVARTVLEEQIDWISLRQFAVIHEFYLKRIVFNTIDTTSLLQKPVLSFDPDFNELEFLRKFYRDSKKKTYCPSNEIADIATYSGIALNFLVRHFEADRKPEPVKVAEQTFFDILWIFTEKDREAKQRCWPNGLSIFLDTDSNSFRIRNSITKVVKPFNPLHAHVALSNDWEILPKRGANNAI